jgi:magnesium-transporting ATPase (P-type)
MSVHIAEILQILACILGAMPVMRTPLQILFLILVTDLAPSIALGLEPGQRGIMRERPRPKKQSILLPWMWLVTIVNSIILAGVIMAVYTWALDHYVDELNVEEIGDDIQDEGRQGYTATQLAKARTVAFIALVWSENVRAYTSRSFDKLFVVDLLSNAYMQRAIGLAQGALYLALFLPGLSDVLGLKGNEIDYKGWLAALLGAVACLVLCEVSKLARNAATVHKKACSADAPLNKGVSKGEAMSDGGSHKKTSAQNIV